MSKLNIAGFSNKILKMPKTAHKIWKYIQNIWKWTRFQSHNKQKYEDKILGDHYKANIKTKGI